MYFIIINVILNKFMKKGIIIFVAIFVTSLMYVAFGAHGEIKPYYSGDAVYSNGQLVFGSMNNDGVLELFAYVNNAVVRGAVIKPTSNFLPVTATPRIYDFALVDEGGKTFAYTAEGKKLVKYNITNISSPVFVDQVLENNGDWYVGMEKYDARFATIGTKELKLWNYSLQNIDSFKILNDKSYNVGVGNDGAYIFNIGTSSVNIFDTMVRNYAYSAAIKTHDSHYRK